jgi:hypothetical protein
MHTPEAAGLAGQPDDFGLPCRKQTVVASWFKDGATGKRLRWQQPSAHA